VAETHERIGIAVARAYLDEERRLKDVQRNVTTFYVISCCMLLCCTAYLASWHETDVLCVPANVCSWRKNGHAVDITTKTDFDPNPTCESRIEIP
jgi:hypothetical protein